MIRQSVSGLATRSCALPIKSERDLGTNETFVRQNRFPLLLIALAHARSSDWAVTVFGEPAVGSFVHDMF
jgi:hypothetical protein